MSIHEIQGYRIKTHYDPPPVPWRRFDWSAVDDRTYDEGEPVGYGETEDDAIADLLAQMEDRE